MTNLFSKSAGAAALIISVAFLAASESAATGLRSFVLFDLEFHHRGDRQLHRNWNFDTRRPAHPDAPLNWLEGEQSIFEYGIYEWTVDVLEMERSWESPIHVQFGWWNFPGDPVIRHIASRPILFTNLNPPPPGRPWKYRQVGTVRALDYMQMFHGRGPPNVSNVMDWDWTRAYSPNTIYTLVNPRENDFDADGDGVITESEYPDIRFHSRLTVYLPGSASYEALLSELPEGERLRHMRRLNTGSPEEVFFVHSVIDEWGPNFAWGKAIGDLNGDGLDDLVVGGWRGGGLVWYEAPGWVKHIIDRDARISTDIEVVDMDGDGLPDVVAITNNGVVWHRNPDWTAHRIGTDVVHDIEVGDFNGNGLLDVVARNQNLSANASGATLFIYIQESKGRWTKRTVPIVDGEGLKAADIDGDGDIDIVVNGVWYENIGGDLTEWPAHAFGGEWTQDKVFIDVADMNGNGHPDIVMAPSEPKGGRHRISWFERPPAPRRVPWREHVIDDDVESVHHFVGVADFNQNGLPDVATAEMLQGAPPNEVKIYLNTGSGWKKRVLGTQGSHTMKIVHLDGSPHPSLFGVNHQGRKVELWRNTTGEGKLSLEKWRRHVIDAERPARAVFIMAEDLDRDGRNDIVSGGWWYRNPGRAGGSWERQAIGEPLANVAAIFDINNNGYLDILGTRGSVPGFHPDFAWAENDGAGRFTIHTNIERASGDFLQGVAVNRFLPDGPVAVALSWHAGTGRGVQLLTVPSDPVNVQWPWRRIVHFDQQEELTTADIDRDGLPDLVLGTTWLRNERNGWSVHEMADASIGRPDRHRLVDMNGNGRLDVVVGFLAISRPGKVAWYEAPEDRINGVWKEHIVATDVVGPMSLDVADLDGDGDFDIIVGEHNLIDPSKARLFVFENLDGKGTKWARHLVYEGDEHHDGTQLVDIDGDGDLDILSIGWGHNRVILYENLAIEKSGR